MYLTPEEAGSKMCPYMTECANPYDVQDRRLPPVMRSSSCISTSCMAWRWAGGLEATGKGYCGAAGRPGPQMLHVAPDGTTTTID